MEVETFEVLDSAEMQSPEFAEEAVRLIEELGLEGQAKLLGQREGSEVITLNPYRRMTGEEEFVYKTLCPATSTPEAYSSGAMPLRVMQVYSHARSLDLFKKFEVWHPTDFAVKDPVLVGYAQNPAFDAEKYPWMTVAYILARWGETLDSLSTLKVQAAKVYRAHISSQLSEAKAGLSQALATVNDCEDDALFAVGLKHRNANFSW